MLEEEMEKPMKVLIVGNGAVGKSSMIQRYAIVIAICYIIVFISLQVFLFALSVRSLSRAPSVCVCVQTCGLTIICSFAAADAAVSAAWVPGTKQMRGEETYTCSNVLALRLNF